MAGIRTRVGRRKEGPWRQLRGDLERQGLMRRLCIFSSQERLIFTIRSSWDSQMKSFLGSLIHWNKSFPRPSELTLWTLIFKLSPPSSSTPSSSPSGVNRTPRNPKDKRNSQKKNWPCSLSRNGSSTPRTFSSNCPLRDSSLKRTPLSLQSTSSFKNATMLAFWPVKR